MKINFQIPDDSSYHQYCPNCHSEKISRTFVKSKTFYKCDNCKNTYPRLIVIDPKVVWWIDKKNNEYWHESVGIVLYNGEQEILFFKRTIYPFVYTIPAGHLDLNESLIEAIQREVREETGIRIDHKAVILFSEENILGDECRTGADNHQWHMFVYKTTDSQPPVKINDEGGLPIWLTIDKALKKELTVPVRYFLKKYKRELFK